MVQRLVDPALSQTAATAIHDKSNRDPDVRQDTTSTARQDSRVMTRDEYNQRIKELQIKRAMRTTPRRGWSMTESPPITTTITTTTMTTFVAPFRPLSTEHQAPIPENSVPKQSSSTPADNISRRPKLRPPRRSYSVQDYEPPLPPNLPKPSSRLTLLHLPSEIHYLFCDYLDPIDSVAFGLAHSKLYTTHRRKYGTVKLSSRYCGPNDREWAWRGAGPLVPSSPVCIGPPPCRPYILPTPGTTTTSNSGQQQQQQLSHMRTKGQVYCRKCGIHRCELHRHLKEWMGPDSEYCEIKEMFGKPAGDDARPYCYMSSPRNPQRCGRHGGKRGKA